LPLSGAPKARLRRSRPMSRLTDAANNVREASPFAFRAIPVSGLDGCNVEAFAFLDPQFTASSERHSRYAVIC